MKLQYSIRTVARCDRFAPSRGRELKSSGEWVCMDKKAVRPLAGAGIEMKFLMSSTTTTTAFAPSRGRELK